MGGPLARLAAAPSSRIETGTFTHLSCPRTTRALIMATTFPSRTTTPIIVSGRCNRPPETQNCHCLSKGSKRQTYPRRRCGRRLAAGSRPCQHGIDHLGQLHLSIQHFQKGRDAQHLARWIRVLVGTFTDEHAESRLEHTLDGLESLQNGLVSVNCVSINSAPSSRCTLPTHVFEVNRKSSVIIAGKWEI